MYTMQFDILSITQSRLLRKCINRNVMLLQQFLPAIRQILSKFSYFSRTVPGAIIFPLILPNVKRFKKNLSKQTQQ